MGHCCAEPIVVEIRGEIVGSCKSKNLVLWYWEDRPIKGRKKKIVNGKFDFTLACDGGTYFMALEEDLRKILIPIIVIYPHQMMDFPYKFTINSADIMQSVAIYDAQCVDLQADDGNKINLIVTAHYDVLLGVTNKEIDLSKNSPERDRIKKREEYLKTLENEN